MNVDRGGRSDAHLARRRLERLAKSHRSSIIGRDGDPGAGEILKEG